MKKKLDNLRKTNNNIKYVYDNAHNHDIFNIIFN